LVERVEVACLDVGEEGEEEGTLVGAGGEGEAVV
jgi:hypothetical protein